MSLLYTGKIFTRKLPSKITYEKLSTVNIILKNYRCRSKYFSTKMNIILHLDCQIKLNTDLWTINDCVSFSRNVKLFYKNNWKNIFIRLLYKLFKNYENAYVRNTLISFIFHRNAIDHKDAKMRPASNIMVTLLRWNVPCCKTTHAGYVSFMKPTRRTRELSINFHQLHAT